MMYFLLTLFFSSLLGITFMIWRKLVLFQGNGQILNTKNEKTFFESPHLEEWKYVATRNIKKYGYTLLVIIIRFYFRVTNFLKNKYAEAKNRIREARNKRKGVLHSGRKEVNNFLKMISEYKNKIRRIKQKVKEEENS